MALFLKCLLSALIKYSERDTLSIQFKAMSTLSNNNEKQLGNLQ